MAGDWIKVEKSTPDKPEILKMARLLGIERDSVFGKWVRLWSWFDSNTVDGRVDGMVDADVDAIVEHSGFASAAKSVGWLAIDDDKELTTVPNFDTHNGETAKTRALKAKRQKKWRDASTPSSTPSSTRPSTHAPPESESESESVREERLRLRPGSDLFSGFDGLDQESQAEILDLAKRIGRACKVKFETSEYAHTFVVWAHAEVIDQFERGSIDDIINKMAGKQIRNRFKYFETAIQERHDERNGHG